MCLDQCIAFGSDRQEITRAMQRTHRWAEICCETHVLSHQAHYQALFGIVRAAPSPTCGAESAAL